MPCGFDDSFNRYQTLDEVQLGCAPQLQVASGDRMCPDDTKRRAAFSCNPKAAKRAIDSASRGIQFGVESDVAKLDELVF